MMDPHRVIRRPLVTEKSTILREGEGVLAFEVDPAANKIDVKRAIEQLFKVKVADVRVMNIRGKMKRMGRFVGKRNDWRKAYVRLQAGEKTPDFFEGV